jgi:hypothetical protein
MSRIKELKTDSSNNFNIVDVIEVFTPTGKSKYIDMLLRIMTNTPNLKEHGDEIVDYITKQYDFVDKEDLKKFNPIQLLLMYKFVDTYFNSEDLQNYRKFCEYNERNLIEQNDLSTYKSFEDIMNQVSIADIKVEMKELENEVVRVHEDDEWLLVRPTTFLASKKYGSNTKWCTTSEQNPEYFLKYAERGVLIYCMNKKTGYKVASFYSLKKSDPEFSFWNQKDEKIESMDSELSDSMLKIIRELSKNPNTTSNRRLLSEVQLEKENKNLEKYMKKAKIQEIVIEYGVRDQPKMSASIGNRLSTRIQNALRREELEEVPMDSPPEDEGWIFNHDGGIQETESESPSYDLGGIVESRDL